MKTLHYMQVAEQKMEQIKEGVFLTVKAGDSLNTMTIGWALFGFVWRRPVMMIAVRDSRHTFTIIEKASDFTVTIPADPMKKEILFCGTKSGRDQDKFAKCNLTTRDAQHTVSPIIDVPGIHIECRIVYKSAMDPKFLIEEYDRIYPEKDYHTLYFGEIVDCYEL